MNSGLCEHCLHVAYLVTDMTILLGMDEKATMDVQLAAIYHDIGKTQIPEQVLNKPGKLTPGEYFIMKLHAEIGYRMIQCHTSPETAQMVLYHHEDYDGGGYFGLQGNDIPYGARILRICDVYDALTSFRCYREPCSRKTWRSCRISEIRQHSCGMDRSSFRKRSENQFYCGCSSGKEFYSEFQI